jgi:hypothetical protein
LFRSRGAVRARVAAAAEAKNAFGKAQQERRETDAVEFQDRIDLLNAAEGWQIKTVTRGSIVDLQKNYQIITTQKHEVPIRNRIAFTLRMAQHTFKQPGKANCEAWVLRTWPVEDSTTHDAWTTGSPRYSALIAEVTESGDDKVQALVGQSWLDAVIGDEFLLACEIIEPDARLWQAMIAVLDNAAVVKDAHLAKWFRPSFDVAHRVFRGFAALLMSAPFPYKSVDDDVAFIRDTGAEGISQSSLRIKKGLPRRLKKEPWKTVIEAYDDVKDSFEVHAPKIHDMMSQAKDFRAI